MAVSGLHFIFPGGLKMASSDPAERQEVIDYVGTVTDLAHDLEAPIVMIGGGGMRAASAGVDKEQAIDNVCATFRGIGEEAGPKGVIACFEALNRFETQIGRSFSEVCGYLERIGSPAVKLGGDTFHMNIEEPSLAASIEAAGDKLAHLHLPDSHRLAPGDGHIDFAAVLRALRAIDYRGYVSPEMFWIAPDLAYLPSYELCDAENVKAINYIRNLETSL
jgi:sugar phosphate isomerase/epimerase